MGTGHRTPVDLSIFNPSDRRLSKAERDCLIRKTFPSVDTLDWKRAFDEDLDLMGRILRDVLKLDGAAGRSGPRPAPDYRAGMVRLRQIMGQDYATLPFPEAFAVLAGDRSMSHLASKTKLSRSQVHRLLRGETTPSAAEMNQIAQAFGKGGGSYFMEYRASYVAAAIEKRLVEAPEASINMYRRFKDADADLESATG